MATPAREQPIIDPMKATRRLPVAWKRKRPEIGPYRKDGGMRHVEDAAVFTMGPVCGLFFFQATGSLLVAFIGSMIGCSLTSMALTYFPLLKYPPYVPLIGSIAVVLSRGWGRRRASWQARISSPSPRSCPSPKSTWATYISRRPWSRSSP